MKVIDLLNKIANGEIPNRIIYDDKQWTYDEKIEDYITYDDSRIDWKYTIMEYINDEVEIIEEEKKIPEKVDRAKCVDFADTLEKTLDTLDKIIDYLNKEKE